MSSVKLEILTPMDCHFRGDIEYLQVELNDGFEGFLPSHVWGRKLLKEGGKAEFRKVGEKDNTIVYLRGGYVEIHDDFTIFTEEVSEKKFEE